MEIDRQSPAYGHAFPLDVMKRVHEEMCRGYERPYPTDLLRRVALVCEESGELMKAALDCTRSAPGSPPSAAPFEVSQTGLLQVATEAKHTAAMAIRLLMAVETMLQPSLPVLGYPDRSPNPEPFTRRDR